MSNPTNASDDLQDILDELATNIHNLSPGDVGSMDRVLLHIRKAKEKIEAHYQPQPPERLKKNFEANLLDGDAIQRGQLIASDDVWEWIAEHFQDLTERQQSND